MWLPWLRITLALTPDVQIPGTEFIDKASSYSEEPKPSSSSPGLARLTVTLLWPSHSLKGTRATAGQKRKLKLKVGFVDFADF